MQRKIKIEMSFQSIILATALTKLKYVRTEDLVQQRIQEMVILGSLAVLIHTHYIARY